MTDIPQEAVAAIKLTRADAVKLVAGEMIELAAHDVAACEQHVIYCRDKFYEHVIELVTAKYYDQLCGISQLIQRGIDDMHKRTTYRVYEDGSDSGTTAQVVFSDHQKTYEARFRIALDVELDDAALGLRLLWLGALTALKDARERDLRVGAMKKEARELLIKSALTDSPEGESVVAAIRALAKSLKGKV
jgi:hypothetical protein